MIPLVVVGVGAVTAAVACSAFLRWPRLEPAALHLRTDLLRRQLQIHPRLARLLRRRHPDPGAVVGG